MFKVQFCGIKYIQLVVQASQPSISTNFFISSNWKSVPAEHWFPTPASTILLILSVPMNFITSEMSYKSNITMFVFL